MCEYCENKKSIKETESGGYFKIIGSEIEHHEECMDSYYNYTEKIPINFCPMCGRLLKILDIKPTDKDAGAMASSVVNPIIPNVSNELTEIQNAIQKQLQEEILLKDTIIEKGFMNSGLSNIMRGGS